MQRPACSDRRCDDGIRLDTDSECENCHNVIHLRRTRRARIGAETGRELPGLSDGERRQALEERLREQAAIEAEDFAWRREQARTEQARRDEARAAAQERSEREREAAAAADAVRQAPACEDCGQEQAGGLCEACGYRRRTEALTVEAGLVAATWAAVLDDPADVAAVTADVRASLAADIERVWGEFLELVEPGDLDADPVAAASALAFAALQAVEQALPEYRSSALGRLGRTEEAEAEARRAFKTEQGRRWFQHNPTGADAIAAATKAADAARERVAQFLLAARLEQLREQAAALGRDARGRAVDGPAARARRATAGRRRHRSGDGVSTEPQRRGCLPSPSPTTPGKPHRRRNRVRSIRAGILLPFPVGGSAALDFRRAFVAQPPFTDRHHRPVVAVLASTDGSLRPEGGFEGAGVGALLGQQVRRTLMENVRVVAQCAEVDPLRRFRVWCGVLPVSRTALLDPPVERVVVKDVQDPDPHGAAGCEYLLSGTSRRKRGVGLFPVSLGRIFCSHRLGTPVVARACNAAQVLNRCGGEPKAGGVTDDMTLGPVRDGDVLFGNLILVQGLELARHERLRVDRLAGANRQGAANALRFSVTVCVRHHGADGRVWQPAGSPAGSVDVGDAIVDLPTMPWGGSARTGAPWGPWGSGRHRTG